MTVTDEQRAKATETAKKMFFGLDPIDAPDDGDTFLVSFGFAVECITTALASHETQSVRDKPVEPAACVPSTCADPHFDGTAIASHTAAKPVEPEPVAWRTRHQSQTGWQLYPDKPSHDPHMVDEPLYAHPAPTREAIRREAFEEAAKAIEAEARKYLPGGPFDVKGFCRGLATAIRERAGR